MQKLTAVILDYASLKPATLDVSVMDSMDVNFVLHEHTSADEVVARIRDAHIVLTNKVQLTVDVLKQARQCRYVGVLATGTNNVDVKWCENNGITVKNVSNYGSAAVAQHALMLMLNLVTSFSAYHSDVRQGRWSESFQFCLSHHPVSLLEGKHAVLVGSGAIGMKVAKLLQGFGAKVTFAARQNADNDSRPDLDTLLPTADIVSLHCPLTPSTQQLMNARRLGLMKSSAFLINTARGELIEETALLAALKQKRLAGAGLDVLSAEPPPPDHPLIQTNLPNLLITPHSAWVANEARQTLFDTAMSHLNAFVKAD
ncbi:D-2-hydroxyacid dehydrogenase [Alteromonas ponticola]|uniref:D-2-hydroxyacid dehydrogenase n=1 Tax=Alteromonas ponticola TaxID=2720613 RepID=A0ABX1R626_9ALTE|nr:D-2-hydroxyacid dehydrogenase [Alteromonas ponticola]NMH60703.1 D-2-hydroxyacid dehydrogenase [Alteromonas ponticola]